jgi:hypothetical protein
MTVLALTGTCLFPSLAFAQATRTWVSGVGDDANPCSRTAPCKTFAGAISKTQAAGEIDVLDPGGYGALTITKSITIDGTTALAGVLVSGTNGIVIQAASTDVVILRNLDFNGIGNGLSGINILNAGDVRIENSKIYGFAQRGVFDQRTSGRLFISNTVISNNTQTAVLAMPGGSGLTLNLDHVQMHDNGNTGLAVVGGTQAIVGDSWATSNVHGFYADTSSVITMNNCVASSNSTSGAYAAGGAVIRLFSSTVTNNGTGLLAGGGVFGSFGLNRIFGNLLSDGTTVPLGVQ